MAKLFLPLLIRGFVAVVFALLSVLALAIVLWMVDVSAPIALFIAVSALSFLFVMRMRGNEGVPSDLLSFLLRCGMGFFVGCLATLLAGVTFFWAIPPAARAYVAPGVLWGSVLAVLLLTREKPGRTSLLGRRTGRSLRRIVGRRMHTSALDTKVKI